MRSDLTPEELQAVSDGSLLYTGELGLKNAKDNAPYIKNSINELKGATYPPGSDDSAIVITAGPSLHKKDPAKLLKTSNYKGTIIAVDAALNYCLRNELIPHYVVTVDPHAVYIMRWFGDPLFDQRPKDDYFERQELDPELAKNQRVKNERQIELVNRFGPQIKLVIATSVAVGVTERCLDAGMSLYWWNPLYDDWENPTGFTRRAYAMNRLPCMVGGGNVATAAWIFAHSILNKKDIALLGMDFAYPPGTPFYNTQRYHEMKEFFGEENIAKGYIEVHNPHLGEVWFTDPTYAWYRHGFLDMVRQAPCKTYNCTEGGIIFGESVHWTTLEDFLSKRASGGQR